MANCTLTDWIEPKMGVQTTSQEKNNPLRKYFNISKFTKIHCIYKFAVPGYFDIKF